MIMWERKELKARGLAAFKANYWKCVLVAFIIAVIAGGCGGSGGRAGGNFNPASAVMENNGDDSVSFDITDGQDAELFEAFKNDISGPGKAAVIAIIVFSVLVAVLIVIAISLALNAFLFNPVKIGCDKFFLRNLEEPAPLGNLSAGFEPNYKNVVKVMFFRDLYVTLWALIPIAGIVIAIVKGYEYRMIPYLLADDPDLDKEEAFAQTRSLMDGQKWRTFVLDLSFIGWRILSILTLGILAIFYVNPYIESTRAALYDKLRYGSDEVVYTEIV